MLNLVSREAPVRVTVDSADDLLQQADVPLPFLIAEELEEDDNNSTPVIGSPGAHNPLVVRMLSTNCDCLHPGRVRECRVAVPRAVGPAGLYHHHSG